MRASERLISSTCRSDGLRFGRRDWAKPAEAVPAAGRSGPRTATVRLITGDRVTLTSFPDGRHAVAVQPAHGREHVPFQTFEGDDKSVSLQADCLTGFWAFVRFPSEDGTGTEGQQLTLSAGDLDEGIQGFLAFDDAAEEQIGTVFERVGALRAGFVNGVDACSEYAPLS